MTKVEHIVKFLNDVGSHSSLREDEIPLHEFLDSVKSYSKEYEINLVTEYKGEVIDLSELKWEYFRLHDNCGYYTVIDSTPIGITGYYDSWNGTDWDDDTVRIGKLYTHTFTTFN